MALLVSAAAIADVYKWTDEDGVVHYSDQPHPGAERIQISGTNTYSAPATRSRAADSDDTDEDESDEFTGYESLTISNPGAEETLWNIEGVLNVSLSVTPALQPGHQVRVYFDGNPRDVVGLSFQIEEVFRGVHNIQAEILDATGKVMIRTQPNRFYVQQNSIR
ncbi:MAG: DUF4124 domain-containing protein [Woeseiaceae bacterium]